MTDRFGQVMEQVHEHLAKSYGDYVAHAFDFKAQLKAEQYLASLSFTTGLILRDLNCPDRMKISAIPLPNGVFVVLGGRFTPAEHEEIRRQADKYGVECNSMCIADHGSRVQRNFMAAAGRLQGAKKSHVKKWWQIWK